MLCRVCVVAAHCAVDGFADVVAALSTGAQLIAINNGSDVYTTSPASSAVPTSLLPVAVVAVFDANGDGAIDVFVGGVGAVVLLFSPVAQGTVGAVLPVAPLAGLSVTAAGFFDFDGDADVDAIVTTSQSAVVMANNGNGGYSNVTGSKLPANVSSAVSNCVALGDIDNDNDVDVVLGGVLPSVLLNDGDGGYSVLPSGGQVVNVLAASFGDVDNDGDLDVYIAKTTTSRIMINDGTGVFSAVISTVLRFLLPDTMAANEWSEWRYLDCLTIRICRRRRHRRRCCCCCCCFFFVVSSVFS